jgi:hypothetical protein
MRREGVGESRQYAGGPDARHHRRNSSPSTAAPEDSRWQLLLGLASRPPCVLSRVAGVVKGSALQDEEGGGWRVKAVRSCHWWTLLSPPLPQVFIINTRGRQVAAAAALGDPPPTLSCPEWQAW